MTASKISDTLDIYTLSPLRMQVFWVLDQFPDERMTGTQIARHMIDDYDIKTSQQAVDAALKKNDGTTDKISTGYKLMEKGRKELKKVTTATTGSVVIIESGKPFSAKNSDVSSVFAQLSTEIRICDPYIDAHTLDVVFKNINKSIPVRILTQTVNDKPTGIVGRALYDLTKEGFLIEVRVYNNSVLHDRYIMDGTYFWLSGNSLNGLGSKESFMVSLGGDIHQAMSQTFEHRWKAATIYK